MRVGVGVRHFSELVKFIWPIFIFPLFFCIFFVFFYESMVVVHVLVVICFLCVVCSLNLIFPVPNEFSLVIQICPWRDILSATCARLIQSYGRLK